MQEVHIYRIDASGHGFQQNRPISRYTRDIAVRAVLGHPVMKLSTCRVLVVDFLESWLSHVPLTRIKCLKSLIQKIARTTLTCGVVLEDIPYVSNRTSV